jgi:hypothetical protein
MTTIQGRKTANGKAVVYRSPLVREVETQPPNIPVLDILYRICGFCDAFPSSRFFSRVYYGIILLMLIYGIALSLMTTFLAGVSASTLMYVIWSVFVMLNFMMCNACFNDSKVRIPSVALTFLCISETQRRWFRTSGNLITVVVFFLSLVGVVSSMVMTLAGDFFKQDNVALMWTIVCVTSIPGNLSWIMPCAIMCVVFRTMAVSIDILAQQVQQQLQSPTPQLVDSEDPIPETKAINALHDMEQLLPLVQKANSMVGKLVFLGLVFNGLLLLLCAVSLYAEEAFTSTSIVLVSWFTTCTIYIFVLLVLGSGTHANATRLLNMVMDSPAMAVHATLEQKITVMSQLERCRGNRFAMTIGLVNAPLTRVVMIRYVSLVITYIVFLINSDALKAK